MSAEEVNSVLPLPDPPTDEDADGPSELPPPPQSGHEVLAGTLARLPTEPAALRGVLIVRRQRGIVLLEVPFSIELYWGATPSRAVYRLLDNFGRVKESLAVVRQNDGSSELTWHDATGAALTNSPSLTDSVQGTDITWMDLSLAFLWWPEARLDGEKHFRGSLCDIVVIEPPTPIAGCAAMRLWVDRKLRFLRQVEQLDETGKSVRKMWVSSVGKLHDRWMIRDMEVERPGSGQRTKLHVEDLGTP